MKALLNSEYASIHGTYWMFYAVASSFASVFLLAKGYANSEIGVIFAVANILAVVLQPVIADLVDRVKRISVIGIAEIITVFMMIVTVGMFVCKGGTLALSAVFVLLIAWHTVLQPLFNSLTFKLEETGIHINFGVARSLGSVGYAVMAAVLGILVEKHGIMVIPLSGEIVLVMMMISLFVTKRTYDRLMACKGAGGEASADVWNAGRSGEERERGADAVPDAEESITLLQFIKRNKLFFVVNLGVLGLYFSNAVLNMYMAQIVDMVGGDSGDMGRILSVMALLEIPTMFCFDQLRRRFSCQFLMKVAGVGYTIKIFLCYIADSVAMLYVAQCFQLVSFALFLPAMVHFIDEIMSKGEAVKGQALFTTMITVTTVISSLAGGAILDISGAKMLTLVSTIATAAGAVIIIAAVDRVKENMTEE